MLWEDPIIEHFETSGIYVQRTLVTIKTSFVAESVSTILLAQGHLTLATHPLRAEALNSHVNILPSDPSSHGASFVFFDLLPFVSFEHILSGNADEWCGCIIF